VACLLHPGLNQLASFSVERRTIMVLAGGGYPGPLSATQSGAVSMGTRYLSLKSFIL
jgi:hypothetical protein